MAQHDPMRWYNPRLGGFEWRVMPEDDAGALALLSGYPGAGAVYRQWRELGASVAASLIRAGEAAKELDEGWPDG